jgi:hypothetical protein
MGDAFQNRSNSALSAKTGFVRKIADDAPVRKP